MVTSKITKRGQTTLPRQVRNALHLEAGQSLVYEIEGDKVLLRAHPGLLASFGALRGKGNRVIDHDAALRAAREGHAAHVAQEGLNE